MPELPEVETVVRQLRNSKIENRTIVDVKIDWLPIIKPFSYKEFSASICNEKIIKILRHGKWIIFLLSNKKFIFIHLRMSGNFSRTKSKYDRAELLLSDGKRLFFRDTRKFGRWVYTKNPDLILNKLGPDAISENFSFEYFYNILQKKNRMIKPFLLDQSFIAGIGNIYADEALWLAKIHPKRNTNTLNKKNIKKLFNAIIEVLNIGIKNNGTSLGKGKSNFKGYNGESGEAQDEVNAYGRHGKECYRCRSIMNKIYVAQRGTTICPRCQKFTN
ncbi:MAG: DNA-formamidopyrimidine glycosylase [Pontiellaceae bacterium]